MSEVPRIDAIVVGAGVVGLAVAAELAARGRETLVLERAEAIGTETSSRNSEVIHAGIYYPTNSVRARLCVEGKTLLYEFCARYQVPHRRIGKVLVAVSEAEISVLESYRLQARANGAGELHWLDGNEVRNLEPAVTAVRGLWSESTGIIDSHAFMLALQACFERNGGVIAFHAEFMSARAVTNGFRVHVGGAEPTILDSEILVNCAGLAAPMVARQIESATTCAWPQAYFARGHYYAYSGKSPFNHLVYPIAEAGGLGVHVTLDLAGQARFGPDVMWLDSLDYTFDDSRRTAIEAAVRRYCPELKSEKLHPAYTGIRPKISGPKDPAADFFIATPKHHGVPGLAQLLGIESPGLTASLAIARSVVDDLLARQ